MSENRRKNEINQERGREAPAEPLTGEVAIDSIALARLLEEVRNDAPFNPSAYNRTYNRHNR